MSPWQRQCSRQALWFLLPALSRLGSFVVWPLLRGLWWSFHDTTAFVITVTTIASFRLFVQPYLMTHGGPENATVSVIQLIYETTFVSNDLPTCSPSRPSTGVPFSLARCSPRCPWALVSAFCSGTWWRWTPAPDCAEGLGPLASRVWP